MIAMIVAIKGSCAWVGSTYAILSVEAMMVLCGSVYPYVVTINSGAFPCVSKKCRGESGYRTVILRGGNQDGVGADYGLLEMANRLRISCGLEILVEEGQGADVEELHLDPVWCELPGSMQQSPIVGTLPQATRECQNAKLFVVHSGSSPFDW